MADTEVYEPTQMCNKYILDRVIQYAVLTTVFILSEVGLVIFIALDRQWEKVILRSFDCWCFSASLCLTCDVIILQDIPSDPTGELDKLWTFINDNADVFMWVGIVVLSVQARFSLYDYSSMSIVIFYFVFMCQLLSLH